MTREKTPSRSGIILLAKIFTTRPRLQDLISSANHLLETFATLEEAIRAGATNEEVEEMKNKQLRGPLVEFLTADDRVAELFAQRQQTTSK